MKTKLILSYLFFALVSNIPGVDINFTKIANSDSKGKKDVIDTDKEFKILALHKGDPVFREIDVNCDGRWSASEKSTWLANRFESAEIKALSLTEELLEDRDFPRTASSRGKGTDFLEKDYLQKYYGMKFASESSDDKDPGWVSMVRREHRPPYPRFLLNSSLDRSDKSAYKEALKKEKGARLSLYRDYEDDLQKFAIEGSLIFADKVNKRWETMDLLGLTLGKGHESTGGVVWAALSVDRNDTSGTSRGNSSNETNDVTLRFGADVGFRKIVDENSLDQHSHTEWVSSTAVRFNTDTGLRLLSPAVEYELEPVNPSWGIGAARSSPIFSDFLDYRLRAMAHTEAGYIIDPGRNDHLEEGEFFVRAGPRIELDLWPKLDILRGKELEGLSFNASYQYYWGLEGALDKLQFYELGMTIPLSEKFSFEGSFKHGRRGPSFNVRIKQFDIGFSYKH